MPLTPQQEKENTIRKRIASLLGGTESGHELFSGALGLLSLVYGRQSLQVKDLADKSASLSNRYNSDGYATFIAPVAEGALRCLAAEMDVGLITNLEQSVTGAVFTDFLLLARQAMAEKSEGAKNVAAVLAGALFEDTIRRIAAQNGLPHIDKLQDVLTELKTGGFMQGTQVGIANGYLSFRNNALHAHWDRVERESVASVLGFVEELLSKHFS